MLCNDVCSPQTVYEQQVETGKAIVLAELARIASELNEPQLRALEFQATDRDFDLDLVSLVDRRGFRIVIKIERDDLADSGADEGIRRKISRDLEQAVKSYPRRLGSLRRLRKRVIPTGSENTHPSQTTLRMGHPATTQRENKHNKADSSHRS